MIYTDLMVSYCSRIEVNVMKVWNVIKKIFLKVFGKAWWFLLALGITVPISFLVIFFPCTTPYLQGLRSDYSEGFLRESELEMVDVFTVNDNGTAFITSSANLDGIATIMDIDTGEKIFTNINQVNIDIFEDDYFLPENAVITDDNIIYCVMGEYDDISSIRTRDSIVRISDKYGYLGEVCSFDYDVSGRQRQSKISRLNYYDGKVTFAVTENDGVRLYSIDTASQAMTESDLYPADADGTFTSLVIPVDGSFIFLRTDGNVYRTEFNKPLGEAICRYDISTDGYPENPYFDMAVLVNGELYAADSRNLNAVFLIKDGEMENVFEIDSAESYIVALDSYRNKETGKESLVVCLDNDVLTYEDGELYSLAPVITFDPTFLMYLYKFVDILIFLAAAGLVINLIIRKKTLLYKQLIIILPVIIVLTAVIAYNVFVISDSNIESNIYREMTVVADLSENEFDGYDFSGLSSASETTGASLKLLNERFKKLGASHGNDWSDNFVFSIIYRTDYDDLFVIAADDGIYVPFNTLEYGTFINLSDISEDNYVDNSVLSFMDDNNMDSRIAVLRLIPDKEGSGRYYLMVSADSRSFYSQREDLFADVVIYSLLIILTLTGLIVLTSLNTVRIIKKASAAVNRISKGDLSARVNYRSKDELGMICSEVNEMGQNLEKLFDEKDETEKFYYKFVPEKFRELLGKEKFTDLALGDAKSCELTVLFCDIRGFSINSEMMTAKENFAFANVIYGKMGPIVRNNNGFVDKYIGDAVMGLFENADDAVRCGIELYKTIVLDPRTAEELNVSDINIGIGVHTGMAMVGIVGESERLSGTVISETVNMSSRLESLTKQYKTAMLVSKDTIDRMSDPDSLDLRYLGIVQVAGVNEVTALYEVLDCLSDDMRIQRSSNSRELREAIRLFSMGRRDEAAAALQELADSGRSDYVTDLYLNYIRGMSEDDKGNVFRFVRK